MTFRPPFRRRWMFPPLLCVALGIIAAGVSEIPDKPPREMLEIAVTLLVVGLAVFVLMVWSVIVWSRRLRVTPEGLEYKEWPEGEKRFPWSQIKGWEGRLEEGKPVVSLLGSMGTWRLPFLTGGLYRALQERLGPLPPEIEREIVDAGWFRGREPRDGSGV